MNKTIKTSIQFAFLMFLSCCSHNDYQPQIFQAPTVPISDLKDECTNGGDIQSSKEVNALEEYYRKIMTKTMRYYNCKKDTGSEATVVIEVAANGSVNKLALEKSSNNDDFDRCVINVIQQSMPYEKFPNGFNFQCLQLGIKFK